MENNLALEIFDLEGTGSQFATLDEGASISITDTSEIFASGDVWSFSFTLNVFANAHIFGTTGDIHGGRLHEQIDHRRARLWVKGLPIYLGYLKLGDEVDVKENGDVSVSLESGHKTFDDMIEGMSAQDVSVGDVVIGIALNRKRTISAQASGKITFRSMSVKTDNKHIVEEGWADFSGSIDSSSYTARWPKLVLSKGVVTDSSGMRVEINRTNVDHPYDAAYPCCNINVCYQKKVLNADKQEEKVRGYYLRLGSGLNTTNGGDVETRYNNAPNFFLLYWLDRLFLDKGIHVEENQMMNVEGLRRVFLANLGCFYEEMDTDNDKDELAPGTPEREHYGMYSFPNNFLINDGEIFPYDSDGGLVRLDEIKMNGQRTQEVYAEVSIGDVSYTYKSPLTGYKAYATGENYPKVDASEIIKSVEAAFGVRFLFDKDYTKVRIILLRNIFQNKEVQNIECEVIEEQKTENKIRGFVMTYGGSDDDTTYNYSDWSRLDTSKTYQQIKDRCVTSFNKTCYLTPNNGNAYRIKIDEDEAVLYPVLMEVAGFADAKDGNCDGEDDTIQTVTIPAKPLIMNDVDGTYAVLFSGDMKVPGEEVPIACHTSTTRFTVNSGIAVWTYAAGRQETENKLDELYNMLHNAWSEQVEKYAKSEIDKLELTINQEFYRIEASGEVFLKEGYKASLQDNYSFEGNDGTPFDKAEIGLQFGVMRSSGFDSFIYYNNDNEENEGNDYWETVPGNSVVDHPDTCDNYGNSWGVNLSLKLRAEKQNPDFDPKKPESASNPRFVADITNPNLRRRGLMDQFYKEYSYWIRNARIVTKKVNMTLAQLLSIDKTKRIRIGDVTGYVRKIQYTVSKKTGLGPVTLEIMYI